MVVPEFDAVIGGVLEQDAVAEVMVFYEPDQELWLERTRQRLFSHPHVVRPPCPMHTTGVPGAPGRDH